MLQDKLLVLRCKRGNTESLCRIYADYKDYLLTLAKGLLGDRHQAEDVVHDVFVSFARSVRQLRLTGSLRGYLATCVCNRARDIIRSRTRRAAVFSDLSDPPVSVVNDPEQAVIEQEELARLRQALTEIPYEQREAIVLHIKGRMKFREIARVQDVSPSTSCARYRYGLDKLRSILNSEVQ